MLSSLSYIRNIYFPDHIKVICKQGIFCTFKNKIYNNLITDGLSQDAIYDPYNLSQNEIYESYTIPDGFSQGEIYDPYLEECEYKFILDLLNQYK